MINRFNLAHSVAAQRSSDDQAMAELSTVVCPPRQTIYPLWFVAHRATKPMGTHAPKWRKTLALTGNHAPKTRRRIITEWIPQRRSMSGRMNLTALCAVVKSLRTPSESFKGRVVTISVLQPLTSPKAALQLLPPTFPAARIVRPTGGPRRDLAAGGGFFIGWGSGFLAKPKRGGV